MRTIERYCSGNTDLKKKATSSADVSKFFNINENPPDNYIIKISNADMKIGFLITLFPCCHKTRQFKCKPHDKAFDLWINVKNISYT